MDRLLWVVLDGSVRWLHVEWMHRWSKQLRSRMFEYHALATLAAMTEANDPATKPGPRESKAPSVESVVVLLSGKKAPWKQVYSYRSSPKGTPWSGVRFRVEAVYQQTVEQLRSKDPFWLLFSPLAVDATAEKLENVVKELSKTLPKQQFIEISAALLIVADADGRKRGLRSSLAASLPTELLMESTFLKELRQTARAEGLAEGKAEGKAQGKAEGEANAILTVLATRNIDVPEEIRERIVSCSDLPTLERWLQRAVTAKNAKAVVAP